jgi:4-amino-4-deoxy-L-arabinose transferase-like glycosyltransferase
MNIAPQTATTPPATGEFAAQRPASRSAGERLGATLPLMRHAGFVVAVVLSAVLNTHRLAQNGYANIFYSAGVKSMLHSLHNFAFVSFDPGGFVSVDKPPLALWVQAASAKVFGFSPMSLLVPEALIGVLTVALLYIVLARRVGAAAAFAGAVTLAVFPSFVAVSRENGVDPLLILLMLLACAAGLRASESGRWRWLIASAVFVGLAFNTKTLAAVLVVPGIAVGYIVCAPGSLANRALKLLVAGMVMLAVSFAWIAFVELTPASKRPYVGSSTNNTELGLTFEYNGFGRVEGQSGGPGQVVTKPGARAPGIPAQGGRRSRAQPVAPRKPSAPTPLTGGGNATFLANGRYRNPIPFGSTPSPVRLFGKGLGDQAGWMIPFALFGLIALIRLAYTSWRSARGSRPEDPAVASAAAPGPPGPTVGAAAPAPGPAVGEGARAAPAAAALPAWDASAQPAAEEGETRTWRRDPRLATTLILGGWFLVEVIVLSLSKGIVHPYYVSALAPATGAMAGAGAVALVRLRHGPKPLWGIVLAALAVIGTVAVQIVLLHREDFMLWLIPVLVGGGALGVGLMAAMRSLATPAIAATLCLLLVAPTAYSATTWWAPVEGTFPAAGPKSATGTGGFGVSNRSLAIDRALAAYTTAHSPHSRWVLFNVAATSAAPVILLGARGGALGGYSGTDPTVGGAGLARLVARGEARYVVLGGVYSTRGGNAATRAVLASCRELTPSEWNSPEAYPNGLTLFDCAGHERALAAH